MRPLVLDVETSTWSNGNAFDSRNKLVCYSYATLDGFGATRWDSSAQEVQQKIDIHDLIVGANFKFDYHWLHNHGVNLSNKRIWDVQTAHYVLSHQKHIFPSLNDILVHYNLPVKLDTVKTEYWEKGIQTEDIPWNILRDYASYDAKGTLDCFLKQWEEANQAQRALILLDGQDSHVLREMEDTGLLYNAELCLTRSQEVDEQIQRIQEELRGIYPNIPINFSSGDDLSAFLYGGVIDQTIKVHDGFYKTGVRKGQLKLKNEVVQHTLPRIYEPIKGSELKKQGYYATNQGTLKTLRGNPKIISLILELAILEKRNSTYYKGLPKINVEMNWPMGILHSNFNQTQTVTGRLSSSKPNQQNFDNVIQDVFTSRFND